MDNLTVKRANKALVPAAGAALSDMLSVTSTRHPVSFCYNNLRFVSTCGTFSSLGFCSSALCANMLHLTGVIGGGQEVPHALPTSHGLRKPLFFLMEKS